MKPKQKHTPGPWVAEHERIRAGLHGRLIARVDFEDFHTLVRSFEEMDR